MVVTLVLTSGKVDKIIVVPCFVHPFGKPITPFHYRFEMCQLAFQIFGEKIEISSIEADRGGISRTLDTIKALQKKYPNDSFRLIVGSDIMQEKDKWFRFDAVAKLAPLIVVGRRNYPHNQNQLYPFALPDLSSTTIRQAIQQGENIDNEVPACIANYIKKRGLYK